MLKNSIIIISLFITLACGQAPEVVHTGAQDLPVSELNYIDIGSVQEEPPTDNPSFTRIENPIDSTEQEQPEQEEQPVEEEPVEEEPAEEPPVEEGTVEEEPVEEEQEEPDEEESVEESEFSGECNLEGNVYNFQSSCISPTICVSRHQDNYQTIPETGFCAKYCMGHINCPSGVCVINGITPGVGYCEE